ncbi:MAG TPA: hypothetical protein HPP59_01115 [Deltaproteobacteria bacterium]|nr:hypothetical protein [Deltaproteobacteria bacterium]
MDTEETRGKRDKAGCSGFKGTPANFGKMVEMMSRCCGSQDGSINFSTMGKKMMKAMMKTSCGPKADNAKQGCMNDMA